MNGLTDEQRNLARHALGLTSRPKSYRNRYFCTPGGGAHAEWMQMVSAGLAGTDGPDGSEEGLTFFWLTRRGAEAALMPGEKLCAEDFPPPLPEVDKQFLSALAEAPGAWVSLDRLRQFRTEEGERAKRRCSRAGFAKHHRVGPCWEITPAGRTALAKSQEQGRE